MTDLKGPPYGRHGDCPPGELEVVARMRWTGSTWKILWAASNLDGGELSPGDEFDFRAIVPPRDKS